MEQTQTKQNGRPKLDLKLGDVVVVTLLRDKPFTGENSYGPYFLYSVKDSSGTELSFFAPSDVHQQILEAGLKANDSFRLSKRAVQEGKKVSTLLEFVSLKKAESIQLSPPVKDDGFKELMRRCVQEAVEIVKEVNTISWQNEDVRAISLSLFIQRTRG